MKSREKYIRERQKGRYYPRFIKKQKMGIVIQGRIFWEIGYLKPKIINILCYENKKTIFIKFIHCYNSMNRVRNQN